MKYTRVRQAPRKGHTSGQSMVEFALSFLLFLTVVLGFGQMALGLWIQSTLHYALREGTRYAITGQTETGLRHDASIRKAVVSNSAGLLDDAQADSLVKIDYFDRDGNATALNAGGNTIVLSVENYVVPWLVPLPLSPVGNGWQLELSAVDRMEPFPVPPRR